MKMYRRFSRHCRVSLSYSFTLSKEVRLIDEVSVVLFLRLLWLLQNPILYVFTSGDLTGLCLCILKFFKCKYYEVVTYDAQKSQHYFWASLLCVFIQHVSFQFINKTKQRIRCPHKKLWNVINSKHLFIDFYQSTAKMW